MKFWKALSLNVVWTLTVSQTQHWEQRCTKYTKTSVYFCQLWRWNQIANALQNTCVLVHVKNINESIIILLHVEYVSIWMLAATSNNKLLISNNTTASEQEQPNASIDTSNIPLVVFFTSDLNNGHAGLWLMKLTDWIAQQQSDVSAVQVAT